MREKNDRGCDDVEFRMSNFVGSGSERTAELLRGLMVSESIDHADVAELFVLK